MPLEFVRPCHQVCAKIWELTLFCRDRNLISSSLRQDVPSTSAEIRRKKECFHCGKKKKNLVALRFPHAPDNVVQQESNNTGNYNQLFDLQITNQLNLALLSLSRYHCRFSECSQPLHTQFFLLVKSFIPHHCWKTKSEASYCSPHDMVPRRSLNMLCVEITLSHIRHILDASDSVRTAELRLKYVSAAIVTAPPAG